jgi:hypothetical protein
MKPLETELVEWFVARLADEPALRAQLHQAEVVERDFTAGGGAFLTLQAMGVKLTARSGEATYIDGPEIRAPEMASVALATLHLVGGAPSYIEIWSYANDYPHDRHPTDFVLVEAPTTNLIDLR